MAKQKNPKPKQETQNHPEPTANAIPRLDQILQFPAGWDQHKLTEAALDGIRDYLRENAGAGEVKTERHKTSNKIEGKPRTKQTALFFAHTVTEGELIAEGVVIPPRKGQLVILPKGTDWKIKFSPQPREIIEFTF